VSHLDGAIAYGVGYLGRADDLARGEGLNLELAVRSFRNILRDDFGCAIDGVER
jgi:hypothetical protein